MRLFRVMLFGVSILLLAACGSPTTPVVPTAASTPPFIGPAPTQTSPIGATAIPTFAPPLPESLTTQELHARLDPFAPDAECELPCYVGLTPGQANIKEALVFYSNLGIGINDFIPGDVQQAQSGTGHLGAWLTKTSDVIQAEEMGLAPPVVDVYVEDQIVQYIYIGWKYAPTYLTLPRVVERLGQPKRLDFALDFTKDPPAYLIQFVYPDLPVGFLFSGETQGDQAVRQVCYVPDQVSVTYLGTFAPDVAPMEGVLGAENVIPLDEVMDSSIGDFLAAVTSPDCASIPASQWGMWQETDE